MSNYYVEFDARVDDLAKRLAALRNTNVSFGQRWEKNVQVAFDAEGNFDYCLRDEYLLTRLETALNSIGGCAFVLFVDGHEFGFLCTVYPTRWSIWCDSPYRLSIFTDFVRILLCSFNLDPVKVTIKSSDT